MSLNAAIQSELPFLRAQAESRMQSRVTVWRKTDDLVPPQDETTGVEQPVREAIHTNIPFRLAGTYRGDAPSRTETVGGTEREVAVRTGHFPASTIGLEDDDLIEITAGENAGGWLRIIEAAWQDQATARRVPVEFASPPPDA